MHQTQKPPYFRSFPNTRLRRLRSNPTLREMVRETQLQISDLVLPLFVKEGHAIKQPIQSMPGHYQWSLDRLIAEEIPHILELKIPAVILFGIPTHKDAVGSSAISDNGIVQQTIRAIKKIAPHLLVIADVCFCEYTDHGHCGVVDSDRESLHVNNDKTLSLLAEQSVSLAMAGADMIAPSGMMDGMVGAIRQALDQAGFSEIPILSYAVKYASSLYGPFREAAEGAPQKGDRRGYQMDPANAQEALAEAALDLQEGADLLMVKPAHTYLDVIFRIKQAFPDVPIVAYHVSGEYAMLQATISQGWLDERNATLEVLTAIKRAGASVIITYSAKQVASWLLDWPVNVQLVF